MGKLSVTSSVMPYVARVATSRKVRLLREWPERIRRAIKQDTDRVQFFHQLDDPYSYLALEVTTEILSRYKVAVDVHIVEDVPVKAVPAQDWARYRLHDARRLALAWRMKDLLQVDAPDPAHMEKCLQSLVNVPAEKRPGVILSMSRALWNAKSESLQQIWQHFEPAPQAAARKLVAQGNALRYALGHYQSATWHIRGNWYWGLDRLEYLEEDLGRWGLLRGHSTVHGELFTPRLMPKLDGRRLDVFFSFRSPYSYLALERLFDLVQHTKTELRLRPIMPMVARGVPLSREKRNYILSDAARIAWRYQIAYGRIRDPLGPGINKCMGLFYHAQGRQREIPLVMGLMRGIFSEGADVNNNQTLEKICVAAGLNWDQAKACLYEETAMQHAEKNRQQLELLGLWGVPTFTLTDQENRLLSVYWGQDRLAWLEYGLTRSS